jgi:hypothetical protein
LKGGWDVRYVTHQFAHSETLDRARRWLREAGIAADRMYVRRDGMPRLAVVAEPGEADGIELVIHAAEMADHLSSLSHEAHREAVGPAAAEPMDPTPPHRELASFELQWHPVDQAGDTEVVSAEVELQTAFQKRWD